MNRWFLRIATAVGDTRAWSVSFFFIHPERQSGLTLQMHDAACSFIPVAVETVLKSRALKRTVYRVIKFSKDRRKC
jgi:hypothetical protein